MAAWLGMELFGGQVAGVARVDRICFREILQVEIRMGGLWESVAISTPILGPQFFSDPILHVRKTD